MKDDGLVCQLQFVPWLWGGEAAMKRVIGRSRRQGRGLNAGQCCLDTQRGRGRHRVGGGGGGREEGKGHFGRMGPFAPRKELGFCEACVWWGRKLRTEKG